MTVAYVCRVQKDVSQQMSLGFTSCMREVDTFLAQTGSEVDTQLRAHLVRRLSRCRRRIGYPVFVDQTGSRDEDQSSSSSTVPSGCGLLPRKLCFDEAQQVRPARGLALRDMNDNTRYTQLASGDVYRRSTTLTAGNENSEFVDMATVGVNSISSTTSASSQPDMSTKHHEGPVHRQLSGDVAIDCSSKMNVDVIKDEPLTPVWRPW